VRREPAYLGDLVDRGPASPAVLGMMSSGHAAVERDGIRVRCNIGCRPRRGVRPSQWRCRIAELPPSPDGIVLTHFIVSDDVERSKRFYTEVLGGRVVFGPEPINVALSNSWIVINAGGGPTDDKPTVTLETPRDPDRVSSFLNIRVKDIAAVYAEWSARGAQFLTPPKQHQYEIRCYIRDPDGHLIEVGQTTDQQGDWAPAHWPSSTSAEESE
jgi:catechol 2,3-dioxygenase-like lactoylglutathione lyase family enzyme